ncbi:UPF0392 protein F13G3.3 [Toxocara canis]|uniref:Glycosyltransferase family 92 protein n=1 Tax=Toxocara canis TaxID=6265 RepID=A0A0B2V5Q0_TOXCA|nr:UPF0392 protein F13G3.3 [Toxocara canis]
MCWPAIRIIAFSQCREINATLRVYDSDLLLHAEPVEGSCPWKWAPSCKWAAFMLTAYLRQHQVTLKSVTLSEDGRSAVLRAHRMPSARSGLHVCVPPLYWYSDYVAIIQFIEMWKSQGASHFFIYYQSISRIVLNVIRSYEKEGIVTIIEWRLVPRSTTIDPNVSIYRIGHSLAHNDCLLRSNGRFVALVDIDEFIIPIGADLIPFLTSSLQKDPLAGSFLFVHSRLRFRQRDRKQTLDWRAVDFDWLLDTEFELGNGPPKTIFLPDRTEIMLTHSALRHLYPFVQVTVPDSKACLYHARNTWASPEVAGNFTPIQLFDIEKVTSLRRKYLKIMSIISKSLAIDPPVVSNISRLVTRCLSRWKQEGCKTPYHSCRDSLLHEEDWIFSDDSPSKSPYVIV